MASYTKRSSVTTISAGVLIESRVSRSLNPQLTLIWNVRLIRYSFSLYYPNYILGKTISKVQSGNISKCKIFD